MNTTEIILDCLKIFGWLLFAVSIAITYTTRKLKTKFIAMLVAVINAMGVSAIIFITSKDLFEICLAALISIISLVVVIDYISKEPTINIAPGKKYKYDPDKFTWIDLGLPSGNLWAEENISCYFTFEGARITFKKDLPTIEAWNELLRECAWEWNNETRGYNVIGLNGNSIFLPALGFYDFDSQEIRHNKLAGYYWSSTPKSNSDILACNLNFSYNEAYIYSNASRIESLCVRPCRKK